MTTLSLKKQLKALKLEKGIQSRNIGEAKKTGGDASSFIRKVKEISQSIAKIESSIKEEKQHTSSNSIKEEKPLAIAPQFNTAIPLNAPKQKLATSFHTDKNSWDEYIKAHPNSTIYHSWAIRDVIKHTFSHNIYYISVQNEQKVLQGVLPLVELKSKLFGHFLVSVPFFNYGGILYSSEDAREHLLKAAEKLAIELNVEHIEYRDCQKFPDLPVKEAKVSMLLNLPENKEVLWKNLGTKLRAQIKKSERNDLTSKIGRAELLDDFYKVFALNMRDLGTPVYSKKLFANMISMNNSSRIVLIYHQEKPVSCGFIIGWKNTMEIPWASTIRQANKLDANMKLYWEILKYTVDQGYEIFDFGRSSKDANTYKFKKQWGAKPHPLYWHYWLPNDQSLPEINPNNPKFKLMITIWKKLPVLIANLIGPSVVKNLP